jgi:amino acid transporter
MRSGWCWDRWPAGFIALAALTKATGTLGGWILLTAQTGKAGADHGLFPGVFGRVDRHGVPVTSLLLMAVADERRVVFATISPTLGEQFGELIEVSVIFCMMLYVYACIAVLLYPRWIASATSLERYRPMAAVALLFCLVVIGYAAPKLLLLTAVHAAGDAAGVFAVWPPVDPERLMTDLLRTATLHGRDVQLGFQRRATRLTLSLFWLRDHDPNEDALHPETQQRLIDTFQIPEDIAAQSVEVAEDGAALRSNGWPTGA